MTERWRKGTSPSWRHTCVSIFFFINKVWWKKVLYILILHTVYPAINPHCYSENMTAQSMWSPCPKTFSYGPKWLKYGHMQIKFIEKRPWIGELVAHSNQILSSPRKWKQRADWLLHFWVILIQEAHSCDLVGSWWPLWTDRDCVHPTKVRCIEMQNLPIATRTLIGC